MQEMIRRYDENFNTKANKGDIFELREKKLDKELLDPPINELKRELESQGEEVDKIEKLLNFVQENMQQQIYEGVKKANG